MNIRKIKAVKVGGNLTIPADKVTNVGYEDGMSSVIYFEDIPELPSATKEVKITARQGDIEIIFDDMKA